MEEKKKTKTNKAGIIILCIIVLLAISIGVLFFLKKWPYRTRVEDDVAKYSDNQLLKLINDKLSITWDKKNPTELTDEQMTMWVYWEYFAPEGKEPSSVTDIKNAHSKSILRSVDFEPTDIYDTYGDYYKITEMINDDKKPYVCYKLEGDKYLDNQCGGHSVNAMSPIYSKVVDSYYNDGKYTISVKNVFTYVLGADPNNIVDLYTNYMPNNSFKHFYFAENDQSKNATIKKYIEDNWNKIEKSLDTYNYEFVEQDGELVLTYFNVTYGEGIPRVADDKVYTLKDNDNLLCNKEDIGCMVNGYIYQYVNDVGSNNFNSEKDNIQWAVYHYIERTANRYNLFLEDEGEGYTGPYIKVSKDVLDQITYILFKKENFNDYEFSIRETSGIHKEIDSSGKEYYLVRWYNTGGSYIAIEDYSINTINDNEFEVTCDLVEVDYIDGEKESFKKIFNLKYDENRGTYYIDSVK